jgi:hypothetical protein
MESRLPRRQFLRAAPRLAAGAAAVQTASGQVFQVEPGTVRDRLWVFRNPINADYSYVLKRSVISPLESAIYLGVPNIIMVNQYPEPGLNPAHESWFKAWEPPYEQYALPLKVLKRVTWSLVGAAGVTREEERKQVMAMAVRTPNIVGFFLDDFFRHSGEKVASLSLEELAGVRREIANSGKKLDIQVGLYAAGMDRPIADHLKLVDVITFWNFDTEGLKDFELNLAKLERLAPGSRKMMGCYITDFDGKRSPRWTEMPVKTMRRQCETGLRWLREGRIEGVIIYGTVLDMGWEVVEWTRQWIQEVGDTKLPKRT